MSEFFVDSYENNTANLASFVGNCDCDCQCDCYGGGCDWSNG